MCSSTADSDNHSQYKPPSSVLIVGAGVFGLSTTLAILSSTTYAQTHVTLVDPDLPANEDKEVDQGIPYRPSPLAASIDFSRIIRPDYANAAYSKLAAKAQEAWRRGFGGEDVYHESGLVVVAGNSGNQYVAAACRNVEEPHNQNGEASPAAHASKTEKNIRRLANTEEIRAAAGLPATDSPNGRMSEESEQLGSTGYMNYTSGWANAEGAMQTMMQRLLSHNSSSSRLTLKRAHVQSLLFSPSSSQPTDMKDEDNTDPKPTVTGILLSDSSTLHSSLTILATGAYTPSLLDLRGHIRATGQEIAYLPLTSSEAHSLQKMPVLLNLSTGYFVIPPARNASSPFSTPGNPPPTTTNSSSQNQDPNRKEAKKQNKEERQQYQEEKYTHHLKLARHSHGHKNPTPITLALPSPTSSSPSPSPNIKITPIHISPSLPSLTLPPSCLPPLRTFLTSLFPSPLHPLRTRPFSSTRLCWYTDTPTGDFLITYHPHYEGLFLATGGSGHGFKFLPVLGQRVVEVLRGEGEWMKRWGWRGSVGEEEGKEWMGDGSRGGGGE